MEEQKVRPSICSLYQLLMSPVRFTTLLSYVWHLCLSLSTSLFSPHIPLLFSSFLFLGSQKEVNNVSYQTSLLVLKERGERNRQNPERGWEGMKREDNRDRKEGRVRKRRRQKAWIVEISLDHCLALWMRLLINVFTLVHNDWLAGWVTIKQIDTLPDKLADWLADWLIAPGKGWKYIPSSVWEMGRKEKKKGNNEGRSKNNSMRKQCRSFLLAKEVRKAAEGLERLRNVK